MRAFAPERLDRPGARAARARSGSQRVEPANVENLRTNDRPIPTRHLSTELLYVADFEDGFLRGMNPDNAVIGTPDHHKPVGRGRPAGPD